MNDDRRWPLAQSLLAAVAVLDGPARWAALDREVDRLAGNQDQDVARLAHESAGLARLACAVADGRHLLPAFRHFAQADRPDLVGSVLAQARLLGETRAVLAVREYGQKRGRPALTVPDFAAWLQSHGLRWVDLYADEAAGRLFLRAEDAAFYRDLVTATVDDPPAFWRAAVAAAGTDAHYPPERLALLTRLARGEEPSCPLPRPRRAGVDARFRAWCAQSGVTILRTLQEGRDDLRYASWVYLVRDRDGLIKVFKERALRGGGRFPTDAEDGLYARVADVKELPRCYGTTAVDDDLAFLRLEMVYGQSLNDYSHPQRRLAKEEVLHVVRELARQLAGLHERGLVHLDLRPSNVLVDGAAVRLFDLNASRALAPGATAIDAIVLDPRFTPPETVLSAKAGPAADVFQLGLLFHQLLTGRLPLVTTDALPHGDDHHEGTILKFALANVMAPYAARLDERLADPRLGLIAKMLDKDPEERPTATAVAAALAGGPPVALKQSGRRPERPDRDRGIIFPARLGLPHRGHIDFMTRLLDVGYHLTIALQRAYTITDRDPFPKMLVAKMVAQSLFDRGFTTDDFRLLLTPLYRTDEEHRMHFALLPGRERLAAVASSNPGVSHLFVDLPHIDQRAVFAAESEDYRDRSWGARLRQAVRNGDYAAFQAYAASGIERIMPFNELRRRYAETPVEFVPGQVFVELADDGIILGRERVRRYDTPEAALIRLLRRAGHDAALLDPYAVDTLATVDGTTVGLRYEAMGLDPDGNEILHYCTKKPDP